MMERTSHRRRARGEEGFTLIELLVVIVILGVLAAVVVFAVGGLDDRGEESACKIDTRTLQTSEEAFLANQASAGGNYTDEAGLVSAGLLSQESTLHNIALGTPPTSYNITVADAQCGTVGATVNTAGNF